MVEHEDRKSARFGDFTATREYIPPYALALWVHDRPPNGRRRSGSCPLRGRHHLKISAPEPKHGFLENFQERLGRFGLELHPDKTRRIEFWRFAEQNRKRRGEGKPETFDFLGFKHISGKNRLGRFTVRRKTIRKRMGVKLREVKQQLREHMHDPVRQTGQWLKAVYKATSTTMRYRETLPVSAYSGIG